MIYLLDLQKVTAKLRPVTNPEYVVGKSFSFHPDGLFSEIIFGSKESHDRKKNFSFIDLHCKVLHPALVKPVEQLNRKAILAINRKASYRIEKGTLVEDKDGPINSINSIIENFDVVFGREEDDRRRDLKNMLFSYHKRGLVFIDKCIVMPAGHRDAEVNDADGQLRIDPVNDYYYKIVKHSLQIQSLTITKGPMYDILSTKMQMLVDELYDYIISKVSKKQGLIRQNILGKRADFTARAVIVGGSDLIKPDEIGIPFRALVKLYEPFILFDLYNSGNVDKTRLSDLLKEWDPQATLSIPSIRSLLNNIYSGYKLPKDLEDLIKGSVERSIKDKVVLAKRDPSLHCESVQGFKPVMVDGDSIRLSLCKTGSFNADFDGDQMAVYTPITKEAIAEVKSKMITSESKDGMNIIGDEFNKDIIIGIYALTQDPQIKKEPVLLKSDDELLKMEPTDLVKYDGEVTTVGRIMFNKILPSKKYYISAPLNKSGVNKLALQIYQEYGKTNKSVYIEFCHQVVHLGMKYYTIMAPSFGMSDLLDVPKTVLDLKEKLRKTTDPVEAGQILSKMTSELKDYVEKKNTNIGLIGKAGGLKGGYNQSSQIIAAKGLIQGPDGVQIFTNSFSDGFNSKEFFDTGYGSRKGIIDRVINTSETGYLSRQLVYALQRVEVDPRLVDCKTKRFFTIKVTDDVAKRLSGRYIIDSLGKIIPFDKTKHLNKVVSLRSPLYCISPKMCRTCYGELMMRNRTKYVGILAGQICGEKLTQTIMRTFHVGGSISMKNIKIMDELTRIMPDAEKHYFLKSFKQDGSRLIALADSEININFEEYMDPSADIERTPDKLILNYAYFKLKYLSYSADVTIDNKIEISLKDKGIIEQDSKIIIKCKKDCVVFDCVATADIFSEKLKIIEALFSGRTPWRNADHYCMKLYDTYVDLGSNADLVHFEVLASNLLRDKGNPSYPARLNRNYNPTVGSLKAVPGLESWLQAFAFENPKQSITNGLLYDRPTDETILEKMITGTV